jgi:hypothetical protein
MPTFYAVKFQREIPTVEGMTLLSAFDGYNFIELADGVEYPHLSEYPYVELSEDEVRVGSKFYGEGRDYRSAYSDIEGLTPDPESLADGKRKTKVYHDDNTRATTLSLKKKLATRNVLDAFAAREDQTGKDELLAEIDAITTIKDMLQWREEKLGIQMPYPLLKELGLMDENNNRISPMKYGIQF